MQRKRIHIIGIGGCGMNGVAQLSNCAGYAVSGSDRAAGLELFQCLEKQGITIVPQDGSGITKETDFVVYSTAIESDNPDLVRARELGIPLLHRAEMLAKLCEGKEVIAVAGTAGKSTVTGLLGHIFQCLEKDPTVYCGAPVLNWKKTNPTCRAGTVENLPAVAGRTSSIPALQKSNILCLGNVRSGSGPWIIEADESDKSFLNFHPDHAIITNIAEDHFELSELRKLFAQFERQVSGTLIKPNPPRRSGTPPRRGFISSSDSPPVEGWPKAGVGSLLIGKHNVENINNALTLCEALGLDMEKCIEAVSTFKGIERRLERIGDKVIDDFAHSPIKIAAALEAVSDVWPAFNVVWRPHGFTPLSQGLEGFIEVFSNAWKAPRGGTRPTADCRPGALTGRLKKIYILPVYYAGGTVEKKITSEQFVEQLQAADVPAEYIEEFQTLESRLLQGGTVASPSSDIGADVPPVLIMGARDPELPKFARRLASLLGNV